MSRKAVVIGASQKPERYSNKAVKMLLDKGFEVRAVGRREGEILGTKIEEGRPTISDVDTVTLYLNPTNQESYYDYVLELNPEQVIFNPGTENPVLQEKLTKAGIQWEEACTLVLLQTGGL